MRKGLQITILLCVAAALLTVTSCHIAKVGDPAPTPAVYREAATNEERTDSDMARDIVPVVIGAIVGGLITLAIAKRQLKRTSRLMYIASALQNENVRNNLEAYLGQLQAGEPTGRDRFEHQAWFELLMGANAKARSQFLKCLDDGKGTQAYNRLLKYLRGE